MTEVSLISDRPGFRSSRLKSVCGKMWRGFFSELVKQAKKSPGFHVDRAIWVTNPQSCTIKVRPGSTRHCESEPENWVPPFVVIIVIEGFAEIRNEIWRRSSPADAELLFEPLDAEFVAWANDAVVRAWESSLVQRSFSRFNEQDRSFEVYSTEHDEGFEDSELIRLCRYRPKRKQSRPKKKTTKGTRSKP